MLVSFLSDQEPLPVVDEGGEGLFGAPRMDHIEGDPFTRHHPEPLQRVEAVPGGFIYIIDRGLPRLLCNHCIVRVDGLSHPGKHFLDRAPADRDSQHRCTKGLHHAVAVTIGPGQLPNEGTEAGTIATGMLGRDACLRPAPTRWTPALM
jgi:hypothetical protein